MQASDARRLRQPDQSEADGQGPGLEVVTTKRLALFAGRAHAALAGEVAAELGVPVGTLRSRVFYGLKALRVAMDEMGVTP